MDKLFSKYFFRQMGHQFRCHEFQGQVNIRFNTSVQVFFPKLWTYYCHDFPLQDCSHVSKTREEFYSVRCTVADMKSLYVRLLFSVVIVLVNLRDSEIKQDLPKQSENNCKRCFGCSGRYYGRTYPSIDGNQSLLDVLKRKLTDVITTVGQAPHSNIVKQCSYH